MNGIEFFKDKSKKELLEIIEIQITEYRALQAKLDALMLEFCPEDMTPQQLKNWEEALKNE